MSKKTVSIMQQWIAENLTLDIRLEKMAEFVGYSPYYCSVKFHEMVGMTYRQYHTRIRLESAKQDLEQLDSKIVDIAVKYGFSSHEAFSRAFRKAYGITPSGCRQNKTGCDAKSREAQPG